MAASRFARVFELAAPDAPGLISFGGQFDPALADPMHHGSPMVGVSGVGLTLQEAFSGLHRRGSRISFPTANRNRSAAQARHRRLGRQTRPDGDRVGRRPVRNARHPTGRRTFLHRATRLADGREVLAAGRHLRAPSAGAARIHAAVPVEHRIGRRSVPGGRSPARPARTDRARRGQPVVARRSVWPIDPARASAGGVAENLLRQLRQGVSPATPDMVARYHDGHRHTSVAAISCRADGSAFAFGLSARPRLEAAVRSAIVEMCQGELADAVVATKRSELGDGALKRTGSHPPAARDG